MHNQLASQTSIKLTPDRNPVENYDNVKKAQRDLSEKQVSNTEDILSLMKDLEALASNLPELYFVIQLLKL